MVVLNAGGMMPCGNSCPSVLSSDATEKGEQGDLTAQPITPSLGFQGTDRSVYRFAYDLKPIFLSAAFNSYRLWECHCRGPYLLSVYAQRNQSPNANIRAQKKYNITVKNDHTYQ